MATEDAKKRITEENDYFDNETKKYITFMCKKGCIFYDNGCTKKRVVRVCARKGLKNRE